MPTVSQAANTINLLQAEKKQYSTTIKADFLPSIRIFALGAEFKVRIAMLYKGRITIGHGLGDIADVDSEQRFIRELNCLLNSLDQEPKIVAVDMHPDFFTSIIAEKRFGKSRVQRVQHHHAHFASVMVENGCGIGEQVTAIVLDGFGLGTDNTAWGGEILVGGYSHFSHAGHLRSVPMPGGDNAALEPERMATTLLRDAGFDRRNGLPYNERYAQICPIASISPLTSSAGRLFDGASAILGLAPAVQRFEGEAASRLEAAADPDCKDSYSLPISSTELDTRVLISAMVKDDSHLSIRAARFHNALADGLVKLALTTDPDSVVLAGGCMVNRILRRRLIGKLKESGVRILVPVNLPFGDAAISAGQAAIAASRNPER